MWLTHRLVHTCCIVTLDSPERTGSSRVCSPSSSLAGITRRCVVWFCSCAVWCGSAAEFEDFPAHTCWLVVVPVWQLLKQCGKAPQVIGLSAVVFTEH